MTAHSGLKMLISEKQLQVLEQLSIYKYLTSKQLFRMGIYSSEKVTRDLALTPLKKSPLNYIKAVDFGFYPSKGRLHSIHHLTKKGALFLEETSREEGKVFYPKGKVDFSRDYFHRTQFIDLHIALRQWAEATGQEVLFFDSYFESSKDRQGKKFVASTQVQLFNRSVTPDGNFCLLMADQQKRLFTLELHRGNNLEKIKAQLYRHSQIFENNLLADKYNHPFNHYILSVYEDEKTLRNIKRAIQEESFLKDYTKCFLFSTLDSAIEFFSKSWHYADNTPFHHFNGL